jgi:hypothetical protein
LLGCVALLNSIIEGREAAGGPGRVASSSGACALMHESRVFRNTFERAAKGWAH